jgi:solute carrier family 50 (sugar transporter)
LKEIADLDFGRGKTNLKRYLGATYSLHRPEVLIEIMSHHMDPSPWVQLCGVLAPIASVLVGFSPLPTIHRILHDRKVGSLPLLPYSTMIINSILWFSYGLLKGEAKIWSCNGMNLVLGIYYLVNYIQFSPTSSPTLPGTIQQHMQAVVITLVGTVLLIILPVLDDPAWLIGKVGMVIGVLLFASPLTVLRVVIETKSARSIPLPFTIASTINCFLWTVFGLWEVDDPNLYIPNALGLGFSLAQLGLKLYYEENVLKEFTRDAMSKEDEGLLLTDDQAPASAIPTDKSVV